MSEALVVLAGESIVCPGCGETLLEFGDDVYGGADEFVAAALPAFGGPMRGSECRHCAEPWGITAVNDGEPRKLGVEPGPRIHLRSADGTWTGWRHLGGE